MPLPDHLASPRPAPVPASGGSTCDLRPCGCRLDPVVFGHWHGNWRKLLPDWGEPL
jgi:hypothetical protein